MAQSGVIGGVLWHHGESDARTQAVASAYGARLTQMFEELRQDRGQSDLPIVVGQIGDFLSRATYPTSGTVAEALRRMPEALPPVSIAHSAGLAHNGDHVHFNWAQRMSWADDSCKPWWELQVSQTVDLRGQAD